MGHGVVGGSLRHLENADGRAGAAGLEGVAGSGGRQHPHRCARGQRHSGRLAPAANVGTSTNDACPPRTVVKFRELTVWTRYKSYILGALVLLLAQSALIAGLLIQGAKRRQAEAQVRASEAELRTSYDRIRDLGRRLLGAQEVERSRIARELHDDISQPNCAAGNRPQATQWLRSRPTRGCQRTRRRGPRPRADYRQESARTVAPSAPGEACG